MTKRYISLASVGILAAAVFFIPHSSEAQFNFFDKAKSAVGLGSDDKESESGVLSIGDIGLGLRDALKVGTERVTGTLGKSDGFNKGPSIHIPLPKVFKPVQSALSAVGMGSLGEDLELKLNRAAETATPIAKDIFWDAITQMTLEDVKTILNGPTDAAMRYLG